MRAQEVGQRIRRIRESLGLTQVQFGRRLGVIQVSVARYEAGRIPRLKTLEEIGRIGNVTVAWLLHGEGPGQTVRTPAGIDPGLPALARDLATFLDSKTRGIEQLPPRYRRRYMDRVNELISRMKRELEEYQRVLESDARATTQRRKRN